MVDAVVNIGTFQDAFIFSESAEAKTIRIEGTAGTTDVRVTQSEMIAFLEAGESVFNRIHEDMAPSTEEL